ncbi:MAG TPA: Asp-tRNA(Asn)/Glu-tRNA(Gln) amidotransferase subunit GatA [Candidatus Obscuribacterales bacterium]
MTELVGLSISEVRKLLSAKSASAAEIVEAHLAHMRKTEPEVHAFNCLTEDLAFAQAKKIDEVVAQGGELPAMAGVVAALKDNICVSGYPTTCSSRILENFVPPFQATAASRLFESGAICLGKTNMDEFAMGSSTENSAFKRTRNPWNLGTVPGGSSGGSTAAVASHMTMVALGSDTGGSIRQPASFCGVVGIKPTYGMVSRFGLVAFASSLDQIGALARSVEDAAITLSAIAGHDAHDSTSIADPFNGQDPHFEKAFWRASPDRLVGGLRVGLIKELIGEGIAPDVRDATKAAARVFEELGAKIEEVSLPNVKYALPVYYIIATAEASANLARYDGVRYGLRSSGTDGGDAAERSILPMYMATRREGFGPEVKRRIMLGTYALSSGYYDAYYKKAQQVRHLLKNDFDKVFASCDLVISPTSPTVAFQFDEKTGDPLTMYLSDIATIPANLAGLPGISIPCGFSKDGMPIGLQILGNALADGLVLKSAYAFEQATEFHKKRPPLKAMGVR